MKKGVMIAIGVGIAIAVVILFGFTMDTGKEAKIPLNSTNITPITIPTPQTPLPSQPVTQGKHFSVNLTETVGASAH